ncbi:MAG: SMI1/KNR4 family protein [Eubacteriales bacterium]|nr:SMI1/KNR4 family protein [Eubacteriales bacterium]
MKSIKNWKYVKPLPNKTVINEFIKLHDVILPNDLINCLTENNGGRPSEFLIDTDKRKEYIFQSLFSYNPKDKNSIYEIYNRLFKNNVLYPVGIEASGNIICYHQVKKEFVLWNHETDKYEKIQKFY